MAGAAEKILIKNVQTHSCMHKHDPEGQSTAEHRWMMGKGTKTLDYCGGVIPTA